MKALEILIPAYNVEAYLGACLDSVIAQTFTDWECIILDDGSRDQTYAIACDYAKRDPRIRVLHQENQGNVRTFNALLELATAEYVFMMDSDDLIAPQTLEFCFDQIHKTHADIVEFGLTRVPSDFTVAEFPPHPDLSAVKVFTELTCFQTRSTASGQWINKCNKLYRREAIAGLRFDEQLCYEEDFWFNVVAHAMCKSKVAFPRVTFFYAYRTNPHSLSRTIRFEPYVRSGIRRIWLSHHFFIEGKQLAETNREAYRHDITKDAFRMILQKNLKKNWDWKQRRELFDLAADNLERMVAQGAIFPETLPARKRWALRAAAHHRYLLSQILILLASI